MVSKFNQLKTLTTLTGLMEKGLLILCIDIPVYKLKKICPHFSDSKAGPGHDT